MVYFPLIFLGNLFNLLVQALRGALFYGDSILLHGPFLAEFLLIVLFVTRIFRACFQPQ